MAREVGEPPDEGYVRIRAQSWRLGAELMGAEISPCERYRWFLWRIWGPGSVAHFVMLNPSTADSHEDDPTIRRCVRFAAGWGHGGILVTNLYGLRSTDPAALKGADDPVGAHADEYLRQAAGAAALSICAWGAQAEIGRPGRSAEVFELLSEAALSSPAILALTQAGQPRHPLYLRADCSPRPWPAPAVRAANPSATGIRQRGGLYVS